MGKYQFVYDGIDTVLSLVEFLFVYKFIFAFSLDRVKKYIPYVLVLSFICQALFTLTNISEILSLLFVFIVIFIILFFSVEKKRLKRTLWFWPICFTCNLPYIAMVILYKTLENINIYDMEANSYLVVYHLVTILALVFIYKKEKENNFSKRIRPSERLTISILSISVFLLSVVLSEINVGAVFGKYSKIIGIFIFIVSMMIIWISIEMIIKTNQADYYIQKNYTNEKNIENLLNHFEAYKLAQENTRRVKHDIKNHLSCIKILIDEGKTVELEEYVESLNDEINKGSIDIQVGNSMVDAIINEKASIAIKDQIAFEVEGSLVSLDRIKPIDWCIIFSNAIDNAIEALRKIPENYGRKVAIKIKSGLNQTLISIENICINDIRIIDNEVISDKKDSNYHGFGIKNIKSSVKKYNGDVDIKCKKEGIYWKFIIHILLPFD